MKKIISVITMVCFLAMTSFAQTPAAKTATDKVKTEVKANLDGPKMTFETTDVDFGTIDKDSDPFRFAKFTNTGTEPLVIKNCRGSCGCTVPTWPKEPIMPGETGEIKIRYATNRVGKINKKVTITTNEAEGSPKIVLKVIGKVNKAVKEESVPAAPVNMITKPKK